MSEFEVQVVDILKSTGDKVSGILVLIGLLCMAGCVALFVWSIYYDKKQLEQREKKFKQYVKEEIENARK